MCLKSQEVKRKKAQIPQSPSTTSAKDLRTSHCVHLSTAPLWELGGHWTFKFHCYFQCSGQRSLLREVHREVYWEPTNQAVDPAWVKVFIFLFFEWRNGSCKDPGAGGTEVILSHHVRGSDYTQHGTLVRSEGAMGGQSRERLAFEL